MRVFFILKVENIYSVYSIYFNSQELTHFNHRYFFIFCQLFVWMFFSLRMPVTTLVSKDLEFSCASFDLCQKFDQEGTSYKTPTQKLNKKWIYDIQFSENCFDIIVNDFCSSTIWDFMLWGREFKNFRRYPSIMNTFIIDKS